jgi:hypothetical protein
MKDNLITDLLLSLSFSFFGLLLIFGLGFVFPLIDPYASIKWIVIACSVVFFYSLVNFILIKVKEIIVWRKGIKSNKTSKKK